MTPPIGRARLIIVSLLAVPLACLSAAHALSSAGLRNSPELALAVFPSNGLAKEKVAYRTLVAGIQKATSKSDDVSPRPDLDDKGLSLSLKNRPADVMKSAARVTGVAREAIRLEPLSPRAFAILALAEQNSQRKKEIVKHASRLSRRDLVLQALVLEGRGETGQYAEAIGTLDEILRVHPERKAEFFPLLVQALQTKGTVPEFAKLFGRPLPWREDFLNFALGDQRALENLAAVRDRIAIEDGEFDRKLIAQLANNNRMSSAARIYRRAGGAGVPTVNSGQISWVSNFPPFDWMFANQPGFRAQVGNGSANLEIDAQPGNGGVIASRLFINPERPFVLSISQDVQPLSQTKDIKLTIACSGQPNPFFDRPFTEGASSFVVDQMPACPYLSVSIMARAWTGGQALTGSLSPLRITAKQ